jgi:hypothetical protein
MMIGDMTKFALSVPIRLAKNIALFFRRKFARKSPMPWEDFEVRKSDLREKLTISEIESRELVFDPQNCVSSFPFGHLNGAWLRFLAGAGPTDSFWSYSSVFSQPFCNPERREGYVLVRNGEVERFFQTLIQPIQGESSVSCP